MNGIIRNLWALVAGLRRNPPRSWRQPKWSMNGRLNAGLIIRARSNLKRYKQAAPAPQTFRLLRSRPRRRWSRRWRLALRNRPGTRKTLNVKKTPSVPESWGEQQWTSVGIGWLVGSRVRVVFKTFRRLEGKRTQARWCFNSSPARKPDAVKTIRRTTSIPCGRREPLTNVPGSISG